MRRRDANVWPACGGGDKLYKNTHANCGIRLFGATGRDQRRSVSWITMPPGMRVARISIPMVHLDRTGIAARIRELLAGQNYDANASRLGVSEAALRASADEDSPWPRMEVLEAAVREYGVDPTWLVTGEYDAGTHRQALEDDANIARLLATTSVERAAPNAPAVEESLADDARRQAWLNL